MSQFLTYGEQAEIENDVTGGVDPHVDEIDVTQFEDEDYYADMKAGEEPPEGILESYEYSDEPLESDEEYEEELEEDLHQVQPLTEVEFDILKDTFQAMTSRVYVDQSPSTMMEALLQLRNFLDSEARRYRLKGIMRQIHLTVVLEDLDDSSVDAMIAYLDLMHYDYPDYFNSDDVVHMEVAQYLYIQLKRRLENFRFYSFVSQLFIGEIEQRSLLYDNVPYFDTQPSPDPYIIKDHGIDYYFFQVGSLTVDALVERYDFRDLYQMLMMFRKMQWNSSDPRVRDQAENDEIWFLTTLSRTEDVARALVASISDLKLDVRMYLFIDGPETAVLFEPVEPAYPLCDNINFNNSYEALYLAAQWEGLTLDLDEVAKVNIEFNVSNSLKPIPLMLTEYTIAQFSSSFTSHVGKHRTLMEATSNHKFTDGLDIIDRELDELVYFGKRDGFAKLTTFNLDELYDVFTSTGDFYDPYSMLQSPLDPFQWKKFPTRSIVRLMKFILPNKNQVKAQKLINLCQEILNKNSNENNLRVKRKLAGLLLSNDVEDTEGFEPMANELERKLLNVTVKILQSLDSESKLAVKKALFRMYNVGIQFVEWDEQIDRYDGRLEDMMQLADPLFIPQESSATGRVRAESRNLIIYLQESIANIGDQAENFNDLLIVRSIKNSNDESLQYYVNYDDKSYKVGKFLKIMHKMAKFNLSNVLKVAGMWLMTTANIYQKLITGTSINATRWNIEFD
jgi:hypothetical protein